MSAKKYNLEYIKKEKAANNIFNYFFKKPKDFTFKPGQYFHVILDIDQPDERGTARYFTISSAPSEKTVMITTRVLESAFKKRLHDLNSGDLVKFFGPIGYFKINFNNKRKKVFLAGGIGITPFRSILLDLKKSDSEIILISSHPKQEDLLFEKELRNIAEKHKNIKIYFTLTKEDSKSFKSARINENMIKDLVDDYKSAEYFIVGSIAMEEELLNIVTRMGVDREQIFTENFTGY